jgi:hypothetical protein
MRTIKRKLNNIIDFINTSLYTLESENMDVIFDFFNLEIKEESISIYHYVEYEILQIISERLNKTIGLPYYFYVNKNDYANSLEIYFNELPFGFIDLKSKKLHFYETYKEKIAEKKLVLYKISNSVFHKKENIEKSQKLIKFYESNMILNLLFYKKIKTNKEIIKEANDEISSFEKDYRKYSDKLNIITKSFSDYDNLSQELGVYNITTDISVDKEIILNTYRVFNSIDSKDNNKDILSEFDYFSFDSLFETRFGKSIAVEDFINIPSKSVKTMRKTMITTDNFSSILRYVNKVHGEVLWIEFNMFGFDGNQKEEHIYMRELFGQVKKTFSKSLPYTYYKDIHKVKFRINDIYFTIDSLGVIYTSAEGLNFLKDNMFTKDFK